MNLIVNRPLGQTEKQLIYELTLKKRKSKKSTMSEKQLLARQQLARELLPHQRMGPMDSLDSLSTTTSSLLMASAEADQQSLYEQTSSLSSAGSLGGIAASSSSSTSLGSSGCSFSRSDSSYSGSSQDSGAQMAADELSRRTELELGARKKEASIKFKKCKLEHLNEELEKRLYQYEYLVAQEKALLGTYNMMLFTNEGVNNFHVSFRPD